MPVPPDILDISIVETTLPPRPSERCECRACGTEASHCAECGGDLGGDGAPARCSSERSLGIASGHSHPRCQAMATARERVAVAAFIRELWREAFGQGLRGKAIEAKMLELCPELDELRRRYQLR